MNKETKITLYLNDTSLFSVGDMLNISDSLYDDGVVIIKDMDATTLTIRNLYWYEKLWHRVCYEIKDAYPFLFNEGIYI